MKLLFWKLSKLILSLYLPVAPKLGLLHWYPIIVWGIFVKQNGIAPCFLKNWTVKPSFVFGLNKYCVSPAVESQPLTWKHSFTLIGMPWSGRRSRYVKENVQEFSHIICVRLMLHVKVGFFYFCNTFDRTFVTSFGFFFRIRKKLNDAVLILVHLNGFPLIRMQGV